MKLFQNSVKFWALPGKTVAFLTEFQVRHTKHLLDFLEKQQEDICHFPNQTQLSA
jgi:hypothetical protein